MTFTFPNNRGEPFLWWLDIDVEEFYKEQWQIFFDNKEKLEDFLLTSSFTLSFLKLDNGHICPKTCINSPYEDYIRNKLHEFEQKWDENDGQN